MYNILYSFMLTLSKLNKKINQLFLIDLIYNLYLEATPGFEPGIRVLQTRALPLGYDAILTFNTKSTKGLRFSAF